MTSLLTVELPLSVVEVHVASGDVYYHSEGPSVVSLVEEERHHDLVVAEVISQETHTVPNVHLAVQLSVEVRVEVEDLARLSVYRLIFRSFHGVASGRPLKIVGLLQD